MTKSSSFRCIVCGRLLYGTGSRWHELRIIADGRMQRGAMFCLEHQARLLEALVDEWDSRINNNSLEGEGVGV